MPVPSKLDIGCVIPGDGVVTNLEFHDKGQFLVMTTSEAAIHLIDSLAGNEKKKIYAKEYGVGKVQYTHHESCIIASCAKGCNDIRYLCLYDNRYLRYFKGHKGEVTSLSMNPVSDQFLSASTDGSVYLWDVGLPQPIAKLQLPATMTGRPVCSYDGAGVVFGVLCHESKRHRPSLKLFDARSFDSGPFDDICPSLKTLQSAISRSLSRSSNLNTMQASTRYLDAQWTGFEFSADGGHSILVNTNSDIVYVLDGFKATNEPRVLLSRKNDSSIALGATFSSDAKYLITSNDENEVLVYDHSSMELKQTLTGHVSPVGCIRCNKVYDVMATGCGNTVLWLQS